MLAFGAASLRGLLPYTNYQNSWRPFHGVFPKSGACFFLGEGGGGGGGVTIIKMYEVYLGLPHVWKLIQLSYFILRELKPQL